MPRAEFTKKVKREALKRSGGRCEAPGCDSKAIIRIHGHHVCNKHYQRQRAYHSFDLPARNRSRDVTCSVCGNRFDRGYAINARRASRPQYCSAECQKNGWHQTALQRLADRFWAKVNKGARSECWEWTGRLSGSGYAMFDWQGRPNIGSRIAYELHYGTDPGELFVCHSCDNPRCVNPHHLWLGTHADNMADCVQKGRAGNAGLRGSQIGNSILTERDVHDILKSDLGNKALAQKYGVTSTTIYQVRKRKNWGWVDAT